MNWMNIRNYKDYEETVELKKELEKIIRDNTRTMENLNKNDKWQRFLWFRCQNEIEEDKDTLERIEYQLEKGSFVTTKKRELAEWLMKHPEKTKEDMIKQKKVGRVFANEMWERILQMSCINVGNE